MEQRPTLSRPALVLALVSAIGMAVAGVSFYIALIVFAIWTGTLWLAAPKPPQPDRKDGDGVFTRASVGDLIEHSATPMLLTQGSRVTTANLSARRLLGSHLVDQDARVAFRHPEAIALLSRDAAGSAIIRGLERRRDIWSMNRQPIGDGFAVIELVNRTSEADISRAHTDFVANASHELRTPLASIIGYVETLLESPGSLDGGTSNKFLATIAREARRLQHLVDDLMSLSRVEAEKHDQPEEEIGFASLVERAARDAAGSERLDRLELQCDSPVLIAGDSQQVEQLVRILVDNALKYGDDDKMVSVTVDTSVKGEATLTVKDRGEGIAAEHLPHLTRRFYRTDPGRSRASGGTGLGLAIVKHIVERHRGRLDIESVRGEGTTVTVRIPSKAVGDDVAKLS